MQRAAASVVWVLIYLRRSVVRRAGHLGQSIERGREGARASRRARQDWLAGGTCSSINQSMRGASGTFMRRTADGRDP
ncbi:unnamed protein product [Colias eurytheme]|nr:unnamed protein product [Colias eurytheme]